MHSSTAQCSLPSSSTVLFIILAIILSLMNTPNSFLSPNISSDQSRSVISPPPTMSKCKSNSKSKCYYYLLFIVVVSTTTSTNARAGETHLVGGDQGWTQFPNYTAWALENTFQVGDTLVFSYAQELHNVVQVNQTAYHQCLRDPNLGMLQSGNDSVILQQAGLISYICGLGDHCENGQKISITVLP